MKTQNLVILVTLSCLLMLASACGKKSMRGVSGGEDLLSSESTQGITDNDNDLYDESLVQLEETNPEDGGAAQADGRGSHISVGGEQRHEGNSSGDSLVQFEEAPVGAGSDSGMVEALTAGDLDDENAMAGLVGSGGKGAASIASASTGSEGSGSSEGAFETEHNNGMPWALPHDPLTASGRVSDDSASDENARRNGVHFSKALRDVFFAYDSWRLSEQSHRILEANAKWLKTHPHARITVEGHCDERGTQAYNYVLGERRADTAKRYLSHLGVPSYQMVVVSYGKDRPVCHVFNATCFQSNRRAHFSIDVNTASRD